MGFPPPLNIQGLHFFLHEMLPMLDSAGIAELAAYYIAKYPPAKHNFRVPVQWFLNDFIEKCSNHALAKAFSAVGVKSYIYLFEYVYNDGMQKSGVASHGCELS